MTDGLTLEVVLGEVKGLSKKARSSVLATYPNIGDMAGVSASDLAALDGVGETTARKIMHALEATMGGAPTDIDSFRHRDKRLNIPTDQHAVKLVDTSGDGSPDVALYPRDPSLDPQLVWRGKDELDQEALAVPVVPIYIQEKIDPRVIIENIRVTAPQPEDEPELTLFDDFDGITDPIQQIEYYQHDANWSNRLILGDSLVAMTSLAQKEDLKGKVQTAYVDPPYGISFGSNWQVSTRNTQVKDQPKDVSRQPEQVRAYRDTWQDGVHSYLSYLRDRLQAVHTMLAASGSVFVQISDDRIHVVRAILDEVFEPGNFVATIAFRTKAPLRTTHVPLIYDYLLWYAKDKQAMKFRRLFTKREVGTGTPFNWVELSDGTRSLNSDVDGPLQSDSRPFSMENLVSAGRTESCVFEFEYRGQTFFPPSRKSWKTTPEGMKRLIDLGRVEVPKRTPRYVFYADDYPVQELPNVWSDTAGARDKRYVVETSTKVVDRAILMTSDPGDLVLDPTCGSGTTAYVAELRGRRWITIDTSRVAVALARQRLMGASYPYFVLADTPEGAEAEAKEAGVKAQLAANWSGDLRRGFVHRRVPHITMGSITNNPDISVGMSGEEIDAAIRRHASPEVLYDEPYVDNSRVRVSGPMTVESLSPHRTVAPAELESESRAEATAKSDAREAGFVEMVIDNLAKAGVQNGYRDERLELDWLDPYPGLRVQAVGTFTDHEDEERTVAVSIGPETGTVGREHIAEAAKEAVTDVKADILLVCAYAFDAGAGEEAASLAPSGDGFAVAEAERRLGKMRVLNVRINADLMMDEELKSTGAGNLFMVFGEPDINVTEIDEETVKVELHGLDIYDPNKGEIRTAETAEIACWFIDSNYTGDAFLARHAYFTGGGDWDPYKSLKQALNAEIDSEAWDQLYRTESVPFPKPDTGRIAVKAINHLGDEAMKVFKIS